MRFAIISDIHANLEALEAVLADIKEQRIDSTCCLGDVIGYGCDPLACLELVHSHCDIRVIGNHEYAALGKVDAEQLNVVAQASMAWTQDQLTDRAFAIIAEFDTQSSREDLRFVHASPFEPERWHYILTIPEADRAFKSFSERICFIGHSHLPMIFTESPDGQHRRRIGHDFQPDEEGRYLINVGAVGQPRDNDPRACYVIFDTAEWEATYRRVDYEYQFTQRKMREAHLPSMLIDRLQAGK